MSCGYISTSLFFLRVLGDGCGNGDGWFVKRKTPVAIGYRFETMCDPPVRNVRDSQEYCVCASCTA